MTKNTAPDYRNVTRTPNIYMIAAMLEIALADRQTLTRDLMRHMDFDAPFDAARLAEALTPAQLQVLAEKISHLNQADNYCLTFRPCDSRMIAKVTVAIMIQSDLEAVPF